MTSTETSARRPARIAAAAAASVLLLAASAAEAAAARNTRLEQLCGRSVTGLTLVARQAVELTRECVIHIRSGGVLRIADSDISGFPRLHLRLYGKGSLEVRRSVLTNERLTISGDGSLTVEDARLSANGDAFVDITGDATLTRAELSGRGAGLRSTAGRASLTDAHVGARDGARIRAARGVSLLWSSLDGGQSSAGLEVGDGGDLSVIASAISGAAVSLSVASGAAASITLTGSDVNAYREPFDWPSTMLPPARCAAGDNLPEVECPFDPEELPDAPSGPRS